jgi:hypothetical protein
VRIWRAHARCGARRHHPHEARAARSQVIRNLGARCLGHRCIKCAQRVCPRPPLFIGRVEFHHSAVGMTVEPFPHPLRPPSIGRTSGPPGPTRLWMVNRHANLDPPPTAIMGPRAECRSGRAGGRLGRVQPAIGKATRAGPSPSTAAISSAICRLDVDGEAGRVFLMDPQRAASMRRVAVATTTKSGPRRFREGVQFEVLATRAEPELRRHLAGPRSRNLQAPTRRSPAQNAIFTPCDCFPLGNSASA